MRVRLKLSRLLELLARSNLSQNHWAIKLGMSRGHWSEILNGKHPFPSPRTRERLLELLEVAFEDLFEIESGPSGWSDASFQAAVIRRYIIDRDVGQGGMGTVYLARDVKLGRVVAIKVVSPEAVSGIGTKQFLKEIRYTARLQHPHILTLYDADEASGYPYYVMPYHADGSLRAFIRAHGRLDTPHVMHVIRGIAEALSYAHERSILHCDVKPENVLLSGRHAYVSDFGIARAIHREVFEWGRTNEIDSSAGTPAYVSPEQASGEQNLDARSDVYSFGCMVFEMLTGQPPFTGDKTMEIVARRFTTEAPDVRAFAPSLSPAVADVVARSVALLPERRYATASALADALDHAAYEGAGRKARRPSHQSIAGARSHHHPFREHVMRIFAGLSRGVRRPLDQIARDLRFAVRALHRRPLVPTAAVASLAMGIGANTLIFSFVNAYLLRPLPFEEPDRLLSLRATSRLGELRVSIPDFLDWRESLRSFSQVGAFNYTAETVTSGEVPERIQSGRVSANIFDVLGVQPMLGRGFEEGEDQLGRHRVVVLRERFWRDRFGGDRDVLGQTMGIEGEPFVIVGVMQDDFVFPLPTTQFWTPRVLHGVAASRGSSLLQVVGRLAPGASAERAQQEMASLMARLAAQYPDTNEERGAVVGPLWEELNFAEEIMIPMGMTMSVAAGLLLLLTCANVANLLVSHGVSRRREMAVRVSLGAERRRVIAQMMTESALLGVVGGIGGVILALWGTRLMHGFIPDDLYRVGDVRIDPTVLLFSFGLAVVASVLLGIAPTVQAANTSLIHALKEGSGGGGRGRRTAWLQSLLVGGEIAGAVVLLAGTALTARALMSLRNTDLGFEPRGVATLELQLPRSRYDTRESVVAFHRNVRQHLAGLPGVTHVATLTHLPLNHETSFTEVANHAGAVETDRVQTIQLAVSPDYFQLMRIDMMAGRPFGAADGPDAPPVVVVDETLADRLWPDGGSRTGVTAYIGEDSRPVTVLGVAAPVRQRDVAGAHAPVIYYAAEQRAPTGFRVLVRGSGDASPLGGEGRHALADLDPLLAVSLVRPLEAVVAEFMLPQHRLSQVLIVLGMGALLLAVVGVFALTSFAVNQRTQEIAVRQSLGATTTNVLAHLIWSSARVTLIAAAVGLAGAVAGARLLQSLLVGLSPLDPVSYAVPVLALGITTTVAAYLAARRAARIPPVLALRAG